MSPSTPIRNVPYTTTSWGGRIEEDSDEYEGTSTSRGFRASEEPDAEAGRRSEDAGGELSAGEEVVAGSAIGKKEPKGCSIAAQAEVRIGRSPRNSGGRCC